MASIRFELGSTLEDIFGDADYGKDNQAKLVGEIIIGEFRFDCDTFTLYKENEEFVLEPKVGLLLTYLLQHNDKFVSLKELHAEVWADSVVSDTAVRRAISKLRNVFGDSVNEPRYIKSLPKRGYKLIATSSSLSNAITHKVSDPEVLHLSGGQVSLPQPSFLSYLGKPSALFIGVALAIILALAVLFLSTPGDEAVNAPDSSLMPLHFEDKVAIFKSDKLAMALSSSKKLLAFSARNSESAPYRLYLKDLDKDSIRPLSHQPGQVDFMTFVNDDQQIVYGLMKNNVSQLMIANVTDDNEPRVLLSHTGFIGDISSVPGEQSIIVALGSESPAYLSLYKIDLVTGNKTELTTAVTNGTWDYLVQPSPDGRSLAFARWSNNVSQLIITDIATGRILQTKTLPRVLYSISWRNESELLILDRNYLKQMDVRSANTQQLALNPHGDVREIMAVNHEKAMLLVNSPREVSVGESRISSPESFIWLQSVSPGRISTHYGIEQHEFISLENAETGTDIVLENREKGEREVLLHSEQTLNLFSVGREKESLLYSEQGQLWFMDIAASTKKPITNASQFLLDAHLSNESNTAYYCERRQTANRCYAYDIASDTKRLLIENVSILRPVRDGFIIARPNGRIDLVNKQFEVKRTLPFTVFYHTEHHLEVSDRFIVWSALDTNFNQVVTQIYNIETNELKTEHVSYDVMSAKFDLSPQNDRILRNTRTIQYSEIYNLPLQ